MRWRTLLAVGLLIVVVAQLEWGVRPAHAAQQDFTLINASRFTFVHVYVVPSEADATWGDDMLGGDVLDPDDAVDIAVGGYASAECTFDIRADGSNGERAYERSVDLCANDAVAVTDATTPSWWGGTWSTGYGSLQLVQTGPTVTGTYETNSGRLHGIVAGSVFLCAWSEAPTYAAPHDAGLCFFVLGADGRSFTGYWRNGSTGDWHADWSGTRTCTQVEGSDLQIC